MSTDTILNWNRLSEEEKYAEWSRVFEMDENYGDYVFFCNYMDLLMKPSRFFSFKHKERRPFFKRKQ